MRVSGKAGGVGSVQGVRQTAAAGTQAADAKSGAMGVGDALSVSNTAAFIHVTQAKIAQIPDVRVDKVQALKAKVESNQYHPDGEAVAEGLVRDCSPPLQDA